jgi:hypothetical protein
VDGSQIREIGCKSRQEVIERLDGNLRLKTKQRRARSCKRCDPNGGNGRRTYRARSLGTLRNSLCEHGHWAQRGHHASEREVKRPSGSARSAKDSPRSGAWRTASEFKFWQKFWMCANWTASAVVDVDVRRADLSGGGRAGTTQKTKEETNDR